MARAVLQSKCIFFLRFFLLTFNSLKGIVDGLSMLNCVVNKAFFFQVALHRKFKPIIYGEHHFAHGFTRFRKFSNGLFIVKFIPIWERWTVWIIYELMRFNLQTFKCAIF